MELSIADSSSNEIALRNEEFNRRRLQGGGGGTNGPLKITDPEAFRRMMMEMKRKAEEQRKIEEQREAERARREGNTYRSKEQRQNEAREAREAFQAGEETSSSLAECRVDPSKDYYAILAVDPAASITEIRTAYKKLSLSYHPDKHKTKDPDQQEAIAGKFREVAHAFDVLSNEELRALYDKIRDYQHANPGKGLPPLDPEEAARMASGAAELRRLRRMGPKLAKHPPMHKEVEIPLRQLNSGCAYPVEGVSRRRVDYTGKEFISTKTFHLVVRRGSRDGDKIVFENEGEETVDTHPGDLIITLRAQPDRNLKRRGTKDLEVFAAAVPRDVVVYAIEIEVLSGDQKTVFVPSLLAALENRGTGGVWQKKYSKLGLYDTVDPWGNPPGDLYVQIRYPPFILTERSITSILKPGMIFLLGSRDDCISASMVGGIVAASLRHGLDAEELVLDDCSQGSVDRIRPRRRTVIYLRISYSHIMRSDRIDGGAVSSAAAVLQVLRCRVPNIHIVECSVNIGDETSSTVLLEDGVWASIFDADAIIIDMDVLESDAQLHGSSNDEYQDHPMSDSANEKRIVDARERLASAGIMQALWIRHWLGCSITAIGPACALLGAWNPCKDSERPSAENGFPIIPWYGIRVGGKGSRGWDEVCEAAASKNAEFQNTTIVGILETSAYSVDPITGNADMFVAPTRESLVGVATWEQNQADVEDADDDFGYLVAFSQIS